MPHVILKMYPGRSEEMKEQAVAFLVKAVVESIGCKESAVSVAIEEIPKEEWVDKVYYPELQQPKPPLYKKPGYKPEDLK